jgi:hypothetical protein
VNTTRARQSVRILGAALIGVLGMSLSGCGTTPTAVADAKQISADRFFGAPPVTSTKPAKLIVIRDSGLHGIEHVIELRLNGKHIADMRVEEKVSVAVDPGPVFLDVEMFNVLGKIVPAQVETVFAPSGEYYYRVGITEGSLRLTRDLALTDRGK